MFKEGEMAILRWPEKSTWSDTLDGVDSGILVIGEKYEVLRVYDRGQGEGMSVELYLGKGRVWGLSLSCMQKIGGKSKRNLPDWF